MSDLVFAVELAMVKAVSKSKKSFVVSTGKKDGVIEGMEAIFTSKNVSVVARASKATRFYSQWVPINKKVVVPFHREEVLTVNHSVETLWALTPESVKIGIIEKQATLSGEGAIVRSALVRGVDQSISSVETSPLERGGQQIDVLYEWPWMEQFGVALGARYHQETSVTSNGTFLTQRLMALAELNFYFQKIEDWADSQIYIGAAVGYGSSQTSLTNYSQTGNVRLLPGLKVGLRVPFLNRYDLIGEAGMDTTHAGETNDEGGVQTTTETSLRAALGLRMGF